MPTSKTFNGTSYTFPTDFENFGYADIWESFWSDVGTALDATTSYNDLTALGATPASGDFLPIYDLDATSYKKVAYSDLGIGGSGTNNYAVVTTDGSATYTDDDGFLYDDSAATNNHLQLLGASMSNAPTTADYMTINDASLTTGRLAYFYSNSSSTSTRNLVEIVNDNNASASTACLRIRQDAPDEAITITSSTTNEGVIYAVCNQMSTGSIFWGQSNKATFTGSVFYGSVSSASASAAGFEFDNEGSGAAIKLGGTPATALLLDLPASGWHTAISTGGTLSLQIPIDVGGTTYYLYGYTTGS